MKLKLELTNDDIQEKLPYGIICETACGSKWNTGKRKRLFKDAFTDKEKSTIRRIIKISEDWYLRTGTPNSIIMSPDTLEIWNRLGDFCYML